MNLGAETTVNLSELVSLVLTNNRDVLKAARSLEKAANALKVRTSLENTRINLNGSLRYGPAGPSEPGENETILSGDAGISIPIFPQISVGGKVNTEGTGSLSLSLKPFASGLKEPADEETFLKAELELRYTRQQAALNAEKAAFNLLLRRMEKDQAEEELRYEEQRFEVMEQRYRMEDATYEEYQEAANLLSSARKGIFNAEKNLLNARKDLQLMLGPETGMVEIGFIEPDNLLSMIEDRKGKLGRSTIDYELISQSLERLEIELERLQADLRETWLWKPDLSLSVGAGVPLEDFQATLSLSFSPADIRSDERCDLEEAIQDKLDDISAERFSLEIERDIQTRSVSMAEEVLAMDQAEMEQARLSLNESELLFRQGRLTKLELEKIRLQLNAADIRYFAAARDLFNALGELLQAERM
jgi:outer membrane protein TolC